MAVTVAEFINKVGFKVNEGDVKKVNNTISNIKQTATKVLGAIGIGLSFTAVNALVEEFGRVNEQVKNSTAALGDQAEIQKKIMQSARETRNSYAATAGVISDLIHESPELFGNIDEAVKFNNAATMLFKSAGKKNEEIAGLMEAINKSFAKGYVDSETMSQLLERSPEAVELLNKRLGTTSAQLEEMASSGAMTVADLKAAFVDNAETIEQKFGDVQYRVTDALTVIRSEWGLWLTQMDSTLSVTNTVARAITKVSDVALGAATRIRNAVQWLNDKLGGGNNLLKLATISVGAFLVASKAGKVITFLTGADGLLVKIKTKLGAIQLKTVAIAAAIILLALLVEDFINFMQGNDSLIGELLSRAGVDVDQFRKNIIKIWNNIKTVLAAVWRGIKNVAIPIFQGIWSTIKAVFEAIGKIIERIAPGVADFIDQLANGDIDTAQWEAFGEAIAAIAAIVLGVVAAMKVFAAVQAIVNAVTTAFAAVQAIVNAVMMANPITWIIIAIVALIAIIVLCIKHWDKIKAAFISAWEAIKAAWGQVVDFFKGVWDGIVGVFSAVGEWFVGVFTSAWEGIKSVFSTVGEFFSGIWNTIVSLFTNIGTAVSDAISGAVKGAINAVLSGAINIINGFISAINFAIGIISKIPGVSINKLDKLEAPQLAQGGYVRPNNPQSVIIGDNKREGEIVSPISKMRDTVLSAMQMFAASARPQPATVSNVTGSSSVSKSIVQNVNINNKFEGDRAGQQKSATAMKKAESDITKELAHGLAYAR